VDVHLDEYVDVDALEDLYRHAREEPGKTWQVGFEVDGLTVGVHSDGRVVVARPEAHGAAARSSSA
jgi:hypothetical protein